MALAYMAYVSRPRRCCQFGLRLDSYRPVRGGVGHSHAIFCLHEHKEIHVAHRPSFGSQFLGANRNGRRVIQERKHRGDYATSFVRLRDRVDVVVPAIGRGVVSYQGDVFTGPVGFEHDRQFVMDLLGVRSETGGGWDIFYRGHDGFDFGDDPFVR